MISTLPLVISALAFAFSLTTFFYNRRRDQRDQFLKMHERLLEPDLQHGRRLLFDTVSSAEDAARMRNEAPEDYQIVNRSLAMMDLFGMYVRRGYIKRDWALEEWGRTYAAVWERAKHFKAERELQYGRTVWPNLEAFGRESRRWAAAQNSR